MAALVLLAPPVRALGALARLPDPLEAYLRPIPNLTNFTLFPWAGFVMAGAFLGVLLDEARTPEADRRVNLTCLAGGLLLAFAAWRCSFLPPLDVRSRFWTTSASFFGIRLGLMVAALGAAYAWEQRHAIRQRAAQAPGRRWSPLQTLGRSSLFIYWIHVELVYGLISNPLHGAFTLAGAWAALGVFWLLMLAVAAVKDWTAGKFNKGNSLRTHLSRAAQPLMF
jgi:uncharacterized membrane protein